MYQIKRILVALDLSENDKELIEYITTLSKEIPFQKIYFLNIQKTLEISKDILSKYPEIVAPKDETIERIIQDKINNYGEDLKADYEINIEEGNPTKEILKFAKVKETDLILLGKKMDFYRNGISAAKILKLAPCSVSFIPENTVFEPTEFVVPIDFSSSSKIALEHAIFMASHFEDVEVTCVHFYQVPSGYHFSGKSFEEFADIMKENSEKDFKKFIKDVDTKKTNVSFENIHDETDDIAQRIFDFAVDRDASKIIIGSRGRTLASSIILGSVADKLVRINTHLPIFVAKERNHNLSFLEAILNS